MTEPRTITAISWLIDLECRRLGRDWDWQGIYANVLKALDEDKRDPHQVVTAGAAAAADSGAKTPGAIRWTKFYPQTATSATEAAHGEPLCTTCGRAEQGCRHAAWVSGDDHEFIPVRPRLRVGDVVTSASGTQREVTW